MAATAAPKTVSHKHHYTLKLPSEVFPGKGSFRLHGSWVSNYALSLLQCF